VKWEQSIRRRADYIYFLYYVFKDFVGSSPNTRQKTQAVSFRTYRHDILIPYWHLFYSVGTNAKGELCSIKAVPKDIAKYLNARVLAFWFMDDGSKTQDGGHYIHTQGFTKADCEFLCQVLEDKWGLKFSLHKDRGNFKLFVLAETRAKFLELITPYMLPCCSYKL
jgi:hypothetical protein